MDAEVEDEDSQEWDSGPFCRHFGDPSDCAEVCARCGHRCVDHQYGDGESFCLDEDCDCPSWEDED